MYHAPFKQTGRDSLVAFPGCSVHAGEADMPLECRCGSSPVSVAFGAFAAVSSSCPSSKGYFFYLAVVWSVAALAFGMQLNQSLCLPCDQDTLAVLVEAEALCGFVGGCAQRGRRFRMVVGRTQGLLDHCILCQSLLDLPYRRQIWCVQSPSWGSKSLQARSQRRGGAHHPGSEQAAHGRILSLLLVPRKPLVCQSSVKVAQ